MRVVDPQKQKTRRDAMDNMSFAYHDISCMVDKAGELFSATMAELSSTRLGDQLRSRAQSITDCTAQAYAALGRARQLALDIDITVEVPDPDPN